jgi:oxygen-independent coproporphyrinogen-3 oxidase
VSLGVYVHVPFCRVRCAYCDFAVLTRQEHRAEAYVELVEREISQAAGRWGRRTVDTLYFGGGTPSRLPPRLLTRVITAIEKAFDADRRLETSLEANPEDVTAESVSAWLAAGIDRVTLGVQSLDDRVLEALGRPGSRRESLDALARLLGSGLARVGVDLIFGGPGQTLGGWLQELDRVLESGAGHLSCYALETTSRTPLVRRAERGETEIAPDDLMAAMYEAAAERIEAAGLRRYEISNFARSGEESRHNLKHWVDGTYLGLGMSAASYLDGERWTNPRRLREYERAIRDGGAEREPFDPHVRAGEALVFGLRRAEGVDLSELASRYGAESLAGRRGPLARAVERGLAEWHGQSVRLTDRGMLLADELFVELL